MRREEKIRMIRCASQSMEFPPKRSICTAVFGWVGFMLLVAMLLIFTAYARAETLSIYGGTQAPISGWTAGHKYETFGVGLHKNLHEFNWLNIQGGIVYQHYYGGDGRVANLVGLDFVATTKGRLYAGFNAGFGLLHPRQIQDVGDKPCALAGRFGPIVGFNANDTLAIELRIDHLSAFTPHDKGRNHLVVGLKWRF